MSPDFIVIGAMKCGTSTVSAYLEDHADVFMLTGEPNFFSDDRAFARGQAWYEGLFAGSDGCRVRGEGSNSYANGARFPSSATRMAALYPGARIVYMVRHPVDRIRSAWIQNRADMGDDVPPTLARAVRELPEVYVDQSMYWENLSRYREVFPDSRIFIGFLEDMNRDPEAFFTSLCLFLGVRPIGRAARGHVNPSTGKRVPSPLYTVVNRLPLSAAAKRVLPKGVRTLVKERLLSRRVTGLPKLALKPCLLDRLRRDAASFLAHCGKPPGFWKFES